MACALQSPTTAARASRRPSLATRAAGDRVAPQQQQQQRQQPAPIQRRGALAAAAAAALGLLPRRAAADEAAAPPAIDIVSDEPGSGTATARRGDLVLVHYRGTVDGAVFDSTLGGQMYRDGGKGVLRPAAIALGGGPVPGVCAGLLQGIEGMRVGGRRTVTVPPALGFGGEPVLAPYGVVPASATLTYEISLLRLSRRGPEALFSGTSQCGGGFANERSAGCADISVAEFV